MSHGRCMEEEASEILRNNLQEAASQPQLDLGTAFDGILPILVEWT